MKLNCGKSRDTRSQEHKAIMYAYAGKLRQWQPMYAWLPIRVADNDCRWFEEVECRHHHVVVRYDYDKWYHPWKFWEVYYDSIEFRSKQS